MYRLHFNGKRKCFSRENHCFMNNLVSDAWINNEYVKCVSDIERPFHHFISYLFCFSPFCIAFLFRVKIEPIKIWSCLENFVSWSIFEMDIGHRILIFQGIIHLLLDMRVDLVAGQVWFWLVPGLESGVIWLPLAVGHECWSSHWSSVILVGAWVRIESSYIIFWKNNSGQELLDLPLKLYGQILTENFNNAHFLFPGVLMARVFLSLQFLGIRDENVNNEHKNL